MDAIPTSRGHGGATPQEKRGCNPHRQIVRTEQSLNDPTIIFSLFKHLFLCHMTTSNGAQSKHWYPMKSSVRFLHFGLAQSVKFMNKQLWLGITPMIRLYSRIEISPVPRVHKQQNACWFPTFCRFFVFSREISKNQDFFSRRSYTSY